MSTPPLHGPCLFRVACFFALITPVKLHTARAAFLLLLPAALFTHEPLFSIQEVKCCFSMNHSLHFCSKPSIQFLLECSRIPITAQLLLLLAQIPKWRTTLTLHRSQLQRLKSMEINGDFNWSRQREDKEMLGLVMMVMEAKVTRIKITGRRREN